MTSSALNHVCKSCEINRIDTSAAGITPIDGQIKWHIDEAYLTPDMNKFQIIFAMEQAFSAWQPHMIPTFSPTSDANAAAIVTKFMRDGDPDLPEPFGADTLAYAYFPHGESLGIHSDIYVNDIHAWQDMHTPAGYNLFKVIVHEIGHSLGLDHSDILSDIMFPTYQPDDEVVITSDTLDGIAKLYGAVQTESGNDLASTFAKIFTRGAKSLSRMYEPDLVALANCVGIDAAVADKKSQTIENLAAKLNL